MGCECELFELGPRPLQQTVLLSRPIGMFLCLSDCIVTEHRLKFKGPVLILHLLQMSMLHLLSASASTPMATMLLRPSGDDSMFMGMHPAMHGTPGDSNVSVHPTRAMGPSDEGRGNNDSGVAAASRQ